MSGLVSRTAQHAIRAVLAMAEQSDRPHGAADLARRVGAPPNYLSKLLKSLADAGVLESRKGSGGGFRLAKPLSEVSLFDIVDTFDRLGKSDGCFLGGGLVCNSENPCEIHRRWQPIRDNFLNMLKSSRLAEVGPQKKGDARPRDGADPARRGTRLRKGLVK